MEWVLLGIVAVLAVAAVALLVKRRRTEQLRRGFGPEYDRTVEARGDQRQAEAELMERRERREQLDIRELAPAARQRYRKRWSATQRRFVDEPAAAVTEADSLVGEVMRDRGYPVEDDFERRAADVSVDHPEVVEHYREAHAISTRTTEGRTSTEDLRKAMVHFRALFDELLGGERDENGRARDTRNTTERETI